MLSGNNRIKLEINNNKIPGKIPKYLEIKQHTSKLFMGQRRNH